MIPSPGSRPQVAIVAFVCSFGIGQGPIPWILPSELFDTSARASAAGLASSINWLGNFVVAQAFLPLASALDTFAFMPFVAVLLLFALYALVALPETRGKVLDEVLDEAPSNETTSWRSAAKPRSVALAEEDAAALEAADR